MKTHRKLLLYLTLSIVTVVILFPFVWMASTSLKDSGSVFEYPPRLIPQKIKFDNYIRAWEIVPFGRGYINSLLISVLITLGQLITCSMAAYAFARLKFPGRDKIFFLYLATLMVPYHVTMIPVFILLRILPEALNSLFGTQFWTSDLFIGSFYAGKPLGLDSYFGLIAPSCFSAYGTFLLRQFFLTIPDDYQDAAQIDGCNHWQIYYKIILPLSKPALATLATITFMNAWKNYLWPLVIANNPKMMPLSVLLQWFQGLYTTDWSLLMAGSIMVLFPVTIVFIINQRFFIKGIQVSNMSF